MSNAYVTRVLVLAALALAAPGASAHEARQKLATPDGPRAGYAFPLAEPGAYALPAIKPAAGGRVLDEHGRERDLAELMRGRISVLAFIYTRCGDICPTASLQLAALHDRAAENPKIASLLTLISMSFDPEHDTPEVMAEYAKNWRSTDPKAPTWEYVTAGGRTALKSILEAYDQSVTPKPEPGATGLYHILRVFLIDPEGQIRNIYSLDFLDPELVLNDVRTLILDREHDDSRNQARREVMRPNNEGKLR